MGDLGSHIPRADNFNVFEIPCKRSDARQVERFAHFNVLGERKGLKYFLCDITNVRVATVLKADRIVVIDRGQIIDSGRHAAQVDHDSLYARLPQLKSGVATESLSAEQSG